LPPYGGSSVCTVRTERDIEADGEDRWIDRDGWSDYRTQSREALIERIHQFGVAGLGGAGFPTGVKLRGGGDKIQTLIINAAECEPYITADDRLMQDCAARWWKASASSRTFCSRAKC
jgi:electron transport complex protein RnfC